MIVKNAASVARDTAEHTSLPKILKPLPLISVRNLKVINILKKYHVRCLWHFTDKSNLDSIVNFSGIISLRQITERKIAIPVFGGNQWSHDADRHKGLDNYVHLTFLDDHPMLYMARQEQRIREPIWLSIDLSVLLTPCVRYSADISNKSDVEIIDEDAAKNVIDFDVLFTYMDWRNPEIQQRRQMSLKSEILIPDIIPLDKIKAWKNG